MSEDRRHRAGGSGNWTSREDWDCGDYDDDGMSGFQDDVVEPERDLQRLSLQ